jgi:hypothetical protein
MTRRIRVRGIRRERIDEDKLALAFLMLARELHAGRHNDTTDTGCHDDGKATEADETAADGRSAL